METQKNIKKTIKRRNEVLIITFILFFNLISYSDDIVEQIKTIDFNNLTNALKKVYNIYYNNMGSIFEYQNNIITNIMLEKRCWITATNDYSFTTNELALLFALEGNTSRSYKLFYDAYNENTNRTDLLDMAFFDMLSLPTSKWDKVIINKYLSTPHNSYQYVLNKAEYYMELGEYNKALNEVEKAKIKYGNKTGFFFTKFISLYLQKKYDEAAKEAEKLCNQNVINKKLAKAFIFIAINTTNRHLGLNGFEMLLKINNMNLTNKSFYIPYLSYLIKNKLNNKALEISKNILKINPKAIYPRQIAITILVKQNNYKEFKELSMKLIKDNNDPELGKIIGAIALKNKDYNFACKGYELAVNQGCNDPRIYKNYGLILEKLGNYEAASNIFAKIEKLINKHRDRIKVNIGAKP